MDDLASIDRVRLTEELEHVLAVERVSLSQVLAQSTLARRNDVNVHILAQLDVPYVSHITHNSGYVLLDEVVKSPVITSN